MEAVRLWKVSTRLSPSLENWAQSNPRRDRNALRDGGEADGPSQGRQSLQGAANAFQGRFAGKAPRPTGTVSVVQPKRVREKQPGVCEDRTVANLKSRRRIIHPEKPPLKFQKKERQKKRKKLAKRNF